MKKIGHIFNAAYLEWQVESPSKWVLENVFLYDWLPDPPAGTHWLCCWHHIHSPLHQFAPMFTPFSWGHSLQDNAAWFPHQTFWTEKITSMYYSNDKTLGYNKKVNHIS